jgi:hypothetical protein
MLQGEVDAILTLISLVIQNESDDVSYGQGLQKDMIVGRGDFMELNALG